MRVAYPHVARTAIAPRQRVVGPLMAGVILGIGGVVAGSSLVRASEQGGIFSFFEDIFRGPAVRIRPEPAPVPRPARPRYASLPDTNPYHEARPASSHASHGAHRPAIR